MAVSRGKAAPSQLNLPINSDVSLPIDDKTALLGGRRRLVTHRGHLRSSGHCHLLKELEDEIPKKKRSFCRTWCELWFILAKSRITCIIFSLILFLLGIILILVTSLGGIVDCPPLTGGVVFCFLVAVLAIALATICCCYHWVQEDEDLPFAIFCVGYCLLLLFIFTTVAGTTVVFTHYDIIRNGTYWQEDKGLVSCSMAGLPFGTLLVTYFVGVLFCIISYCACLCALGATSDV